MSFCVHDSGSTYRRMCDCDGWLADLTEAETQAPAPRARSDDAVPVDCDDAEPVDCQDDLRVALAKVERCEHRIAERDFCPGCGSDELDMPCGHEWHGEETL